jgi:ornithine carbamoyltransferase
MRSPVPLVNPPVSHLLSIADLGPEGIKDVVEHAVVLKAQGGAVASRVQPLAGRQVALLFDKPSLRTRVSFEVGIRRLGGATTSLSAAEIGLGSREPIADIARTLSRYVDAIVIRIHSHAQLAELAAAAEVPVVNALTEHEHPCQALADLQTIREHLGGFSGRRLAYLGDGNNVCHSLLLGSAAAGLSVRVACPVGYEPDRAVVDEARLLAHESGATIAIGHDPAAAVHGADAVYTDVWASMGFEQEAAERARAFAPFRVTQALMAGAPEAIVMHCLPAHRGQEIDAEVIDGPASVVFDQAENRMHAQEALLVRLLRPRWQGLAVADLFAPVHIATPLRLAARR